MLSLQKQNDHLQKVSRSFALTIPVLNARLQDIIANAYLLCRIADTVEDDPALGTDKKIQWLYDFARLADRLFADEALALSLKDRSEVLKDSAKEYEYCLMLDMVEVIQRTLSYEKPYIEVVARGVALLSYGMAQHLETTSIGTLEDLDSYCYSVAGVVGELLARLFAIDENMEESVRKHLIVLSVSFGEGLQLTNILKDRSEDIKRGVSFLPPLDADEKESVIKYTAVTAGHLFDAIDFICSLPKDKSGSRMFCLTNVIMALLTLKKIGKNPFGDQSCLKISRRQVFIVYALCKLFCRNNSALRLIAYTASSGLTIQKRDYSELYHRVSMWQSSMPL